MGEDRRYNEYLKSLPPELRAKVMAERRDEQARASIGGFDAAIATAGDAALSVAVVAFAEAKNDREREDAIRCTAIVITTLQQIKSVLHHVLPSGPKAQILNIITNGCAQGVGQFDQLVRNLLPQGAARRARILEKGFAAVEAEDMAEAVRNKAVIDNTPEAMAKLREDLGITQEPFGQTEAGGTVSVGPPPGPETCGACRDAGTNCGMHS